MSFLARRYRERMDLDLLTCQEHGYFSHFATHESGHAVAAVILGFEFMHVSIAPPAQTLMGIRGGTAVEAGGILMMTDRPIEWVGPRPADALTYLLAGSVSEELLLDHHLSNGFTGDLNIWRRGTERFGGMSPAEKPLLLAGRERAKRLVTENRAAVERVRDMLASRAPTDFEGNLLAFSKPIVVTYAEAVAAVLDSY